MQVIKHKIDFRDVGTYGDMGTGSPNQFLADNLTLFDSNQDEYYAHHIANCPHQDF